MSTNEPTFENRRAPVTAASLPKTMDYGKLPADAPGAPPGEIRVAKHIASDALVIAFPFPDATLEIRPRLEVTTRWRAPNRAPTQVILPCCPHEKRVWKIVTPSAPPPPMRSNAG